MAGVIGRRERLAPGVDFDAECRALAILIQ